MSVQHDPPRQGLWGNAPPEMSRFSIRRYSIQHFVLLVLVNFLLVTLTIAAILWGNLALVALSAAAMVAVWAKTALVMWAGLRTGRRDGSGLGWELPYGSNSATTNPKACEALETLRVRSMRS